MEVAPRILVQRSTAYRAGVGVGHRGSPCRSSGQLAIAFNDSRSRNILRHQQATIDRASGIAVAENPAIGQFQLFADIIPRGGGLFIDALTLIAAKALATNAIGAEVGVAKRRHVILLRSWASLKAALACGSGMLVVDIDNNTLPTTIVSR